MSDNPYLKKLKVFDPKSDLQVSEVFRFDGASPGADMLGAGEDEGLDEGSRSDAGKETASLRVGAPVSAGIVKITAGDGRTILIACDTSGGVYLLTPGQGALAALAKFKIPGSIIRRPAYADGIIYITTREGLVVAVNTGLSAQGGDGKITPQMLWQKKLAKGILTEPLSTGKILIVAALDGLHAFEAYFKDAENKAIGKEMWHQPMNGTTSSPTIDGGIIFQGSEEKKFFAFEYGGNRINTSWQFDANAQIRCRPYVALKNGFVLFASMDGSVYCLDKAQKKLLWVFLVKAPVYSSVISAPFDSGEFFYFGADDGNFYCVNAQGKEVWKFKTNGKIRTDALHHEGTVYFGSEDNNLYGLNARSGKIIFKFATDGNINGAPVIVDNQLYFGSTDSFVHGLSL
jgi:outer membrane protein assembly factor BamB